MKKFFVILILFFPIASKAQRQDTFYFYHSDTVIQSIRTVTTVNKPIIVTPKEQKFALWYILDVYKNGSSESSLVDSFVPNKWPLGFLSGTIYKKLTTYRSVPQVSGVPVMVGDDPVVTKVESIPNYFFLISLGAGFVLLLIAYFMISIDYKNGRKSVSTWRSFLNWAGVIFVIFLSDCASFLSGLIILGYSYNPANEMIAVSVIQALSLVIFSRIINRKYPVSK